MTDLGLTGYTLKLPVLDNWLYLRVILADQPFEKRRYQMNKIRLYLQSLRSWLYSSASPRKKVLMFHFQNHTIHFRRQIRRMNAVQLNQEQVLYLDVAEEEE